MASKLMSILSSDILVLKFILVLFFKFLKQLLLYYYNTDQHNYIIITRYRYSNSVCLSIRLSVRDVLVSDENGLTYRHSFFHHTVAQSF